MVHIDIEERSFYKFAISLHVILEIAFQFNIGLETNIQ